MNPRFQIQRELLSKLLAVGAIGQSHFIAAMQMVDTEEANAEELHVAQRDLDRDEWRQRPWWRKVFTLDRKPMGA